jgi:hypothetical protein
MCGIAPSNEASHGFELSPVQILQMLTTIKLERVYLAVLTDFQVKLHIGRLQSNRNQDGMISSKNDSTTYYDRIFNSSEADHEVE